MQQYFIPAVVGFIIVCVGSFLARHMGWYSEYWFTDITLHTISGVWLALLAISFLKDRGFILLVSATSFAVFGSVLWEFWEFAGWRLTPAQVPFYIPQLPDTLGDICCGMVGGFVVSLVIVLFSRKVRT